MPEGFGCRKLGSKHTVTSLFFFIGQPFRAQVHATKDSKLGGFIKEAKIDGKSFLRDLI